MQRESDVCESVCEAGVLVQGCRRCHACYLCVCALCVCVFVSLVEASSATISREQVLGHFEAHCYRVPTHADLQPSTMALTNNGTNFQKYSTFSKDLDILTLDSKYTRALTS